MQQAIKWGGRFRQKVQALRISLAAFGMILGLILCSELARGSSWPETVAKFAAERTRFTACAQMAQSDSARREKLRLEAGRFNNALGGLIGHIVSQDTRLPNEIIHNLFQSMQNRSEICVPIVRGETGLRCPQLPMEAVYTNEGVLNSALNLMIQTARTDRLKAQTIQSQLSVQEWSLESASTNASPNPCQAGAAAAGPEGRNGQGHGTTR